MSLSHAKGGAIGAVARGLAVWLSRLSLLALALSMAMAAAHMPAGLAATHGVAGLVALAVLIVSFVKPVWGFVVGAVILALACYGAVFWARMIDGPTGLGLGLVLVALSFAAAWLSRGSDRKGRA